MDNQQSIKFTKLMKQIKAFCRNPRGVMGRGTFVFPDGHEFTRIVLNYEWYQQQCRYHEEEW